MVIKASPRRQGTLKIWASPSPKPKVNEREGRRENRERTEGVASKAKNLQLLPSPLSPVPVGGAALAVVNCGTANLGDCSSSRFEGVEQ